MYHSLLPAPPSGDARDADRGRAEGELYAVNPRLFTICSFRGTWGEPETQPDGKGSC